MAQDKNPRRYTLSVVAVDPIPHVGLKGPHVVLEFQGALSSRAKREIGQALDSGSYHLTEKKLA